MCSHYSNHHRGICLEFDAIQPEISGAWQVKYMRALLRLPPRLTQTVKTQLTVR